MQLTSLNRHRMEIVMLLAGLALAGVIVAADADPKGQQLERWKEELRQVDRDFCALAAKEGVGKAFLAFAADEVILLRDKQPPVLGKTALEAHFAKSPGGYTLTWQPEKADVAASGELGYTFGRWELRSKDAEGKDVQLFGVYVTIWKRQADGTWKYVLDGGTQTPAPERP